MFVYGKKQQRWIYVVAGLVFMVYPYFTTTTTSMTAVGVALGAAVWLATRAGW
jgi:hypothetical protein